MKFAKRSIPFFALALTVLFFGSAFGGGIHQYPPRGETAGAAYTDTIEYAAGDILMWANADGDTIKAVIWKDAAGTELVPTFSEINSAFSSALSGYGLTVTGTNLTELTDASETTLHSHAGGGGALDDSVTTDSMLVNEELSLGGFTRHRERAAFKLQDIRDAADNGHSVRAIIQYKDEYFAALDVGGAGGFGLVYHMNPDTSTYGTFTEEDNPGSGYAPMSFAIYKGDLYVGYGQDANDGDIAVWNEALGDWTVVYNGSYDTVYDLCVYGDSLYAGMGDASGEGDVLSTGDGSSWVVTHNTIDYTVKALEVWNGKLYASTSTAASGGYGYLWEYDGDTWTVIGNPNTTHDIICMKGFGKYLFMGMGEGTGEGDVYTWDGRAFNSFSLDTSYDAVYALEAYNGRLYIGYYDGTDGGDVAALNGEDGTTTILNLTGTNDATSAFFADLDGTLWIGSGWGVDQSQIYKYTSGGNQYQGEQDPFIYDRHFRRKVSFKDSTFFAGPISAESNLMIGGTSGYGSDLSVVISVGDTPNTTPANATVLTTVDVGGSAELGVWDEADNFSILSANVEKFPDALAVDTSHPYAKRYENRRVGLRTFIAERRAFLLLQEMAHNGGFLPLDSLIVAEENIPVKDWDTAEEEARLHSVTVRERWFTKRTKIIALSDSMLSAGWPTKELPVIPSIEDAPPIYVKKPRPDWVTRSLQHQGKE